jgi:hypothetical protein
MCLRIPKMLNCYIILESFIPLEDKNTPASLLTFLFAASHIPSSPGIASNYTLRTITTCNKYITIENNKSITVDCYLHALSTADLSLSISNDCY